LQLRIDTLPSAASRIKHSICILRDWSHSSLNSTMTSYPIILQVRNINGIWNFFVRSKAAFCPFSFDTQKTVTFDEQNKKSEHLKMLARGPIHFERIFLILRVLNWSAFWGTESTLNLRMILSKVTFIHRRGFFIFFSRFWSRIATQPKKDQLAHQSLSRRSWDPFTGLFWKHKRVHPSNKCYSCLTCRRLFMDYGSRHLHRIVSMHVRHWTHSLISISRPL
jgi:hypothetical protein